MASLPYGLAGNHKTNGAVRAPGEALPITEALEKCQSALGEAENWMSRLENGLFGPYLECEACEPAPKNTDVSFRACDIGARLETLRRRIESATTRVGGP